MNVEQQKRSLIDKIATQTDAYLLFRLAQFLDEATRSSQSTTTRQAGFGKGTFCYVSDDFDDALPPGFDEYLLAADPDKQPR